MNKIKNWFTLVELIVVITILAILWTIAFVSFQWYSTQTRDSVRITDLKNIDKSLALKVIEGEKLRVPNNEILITSSWVLMNHQWRLWKELLSYYWISNWWLDPLNGLPYTYILNKSQNRYQLLGFLEQGDNITLLGWETYANNSWSFPHSEWDVLGIILDEINKKPLIKSIGLSEIDIETTTDNYAVLLEDWEDIKSGNKDFLQSKLDFRVMPKKNCYSLLLNGYSKWDGIYVINPTGNEQIKVYCDMTTNGWGWTLAVSQMHSSNQYAWSVSPFTQDLNKLSPSILKWYSRNWEEQKVTPKKIMIVDGKNTKYVSADVEKWCGWEWLQDPTSCWIPWVTNQHKTYAKLKNSELAESLYFSSCAAYGWCYSTWAEWWGFSLKPERTYANTKSWGYSWTADKLGNWHRYAWWMWWTEIYPSGANSHMLLYFK